MSRSPRPRFPVPARRREGAEGVEFAIRAASLPVALGSTIFLFALGSASSTSLRHVGTEGRWIALVLLLAVVVAERARCRIELRVELVLALLVVVLALMSALWSVDPSLTVERAVSLLLLFGVTSALGLRCHRNEKEGILVFGGILLGAVAVVVAGFVFYAFEPQAALQGARPTSAWRFAGIGENPNTVPMLAAVATPIAVAGALTLHRRALQLAASVGFVLLLAEIALSGARGAFASAAIGAIASTLAAPMHDRRRLVAVTAVAAAFVVAFGVDHVIARPSLQVAGGGTSATTPAAGGAAGGAGSVGSGTSEPAVVWSRLSVLDPASLGSCKQLDQVGRPQPGVKTAILPPRPQGLFGLSGRGAAWNEALRESSQRPVAGYGFGTEDRVFFDCFGVFLGTRPENSYLGLVLQLGATGLAAFLALGAALLLAAVRALRQPGFLARAMGAAACGALVAGGLLAVDQSYVYSVGNVATLSFWAAGFVGASAAWSPRDRRRVSLTWTHVVVALVGVAALAAVVAIGRLERRHQLGDQLRGIARVREAVGPLNSSTLTAYRWAPGYRCLAYRRGVRLYALEICFDPRFRVVDASDRRGPTPRVYSLRFAPQAATTTLPASEARAALQRLRVPGIRAIWAGWVAGIDGCTSAVGKPSARPRLVSARSLLPLAVTRCRDVVRVLGDGAAAAAAGSPTLARSGAELARDIASFESSLNAAEKRLHESASLARAGLRQLNRARNRLVEGRLPPIVRMLVRKEPALSVVPPPAA